MKDVVNQPTHYRGGAYEAIKVISAWGLNFARGNVVKYICRAGLKSAETELEDLRKARVYLDHEIQRLAELRRLASDHPALESEPDS